MSTLHMMKQQIWEELEAQRIAGLWEKIINTSAGFSIDDLKNAALFKAEEDHRTAVSEELSKLGLLNKGMAKGSPQIRTRSNPVFEINVSYSDIRREIAMEKRPDVSDPAREK